MQALKSSDQPAGPSSAPAAAPVPKKTQDGGSKASIHYPFWFGGSASCMAAFVTHPLDLVHTNTPSPKTSQVRLQMRTGDMPKNMSGTFVHIVRNNGVLGLYNGLSASVFRQITYSTVRFGIYEELKSRAEARARDRGAGRPSSLALVGIATVSGFVGGFAGNGADVLNVRMQHDAALPPEQRRNYRHALHGLATMAREEGIARAWLRGVFPNAVRAAAMTASQLASYDTCKRLLMANTPLGDTLSTHFAASFMAGVVAATVTSPIDVVKTRVMASGDHGLASALKELFAADGMRWMFKGWVPSFLRLGPHTIATFVFLEMHRKVYRKTKGLES
ncbi:uncharacterized protein E0L32_006349 [Thyridium curvatum]|uniref:Mitochondrial dicarboxylate carrier n=1 Tax=Thyridium curvatum TaxID=1093900 RepID=A0A507B6X1_9PEZI|nr:uncharacterized protein E0L32_006349 [Thyridium curvatum]TPX13149.1 hypothetical protein E0L32_006349 [Thyridium curvatum]